jgi:hypothetical protein
VKRKVLEFNLGGWCMNDEAAPTYHAAVNQMTLGHQFILREFGEDARPTVGWHVDPFGHGAGTASLWADMGFDAFGLNRIDDREKEQRKERQTLEFIWRGSDTLGAKSQLFAHVLVTFQAALHSPALFPRICSLLTATACDPGSPGLALRHPCGDELRRQHAHQYGRRLAHVPDQQGPAGRGFRQGEEH